MGPSREDRTGVHLAHESDDRDAGLALPGDDRPMDRRRASVLRQEGRVNIEGAKPRGGKHRIRQDPAVGGDNREVGV